MFCGHCGQPSPGDSQFCPACGKSLGIAAPAAQQPATPPPPPVGAPDLPPPQTSGKAIASLILGCFAFFFPAAIAAIILGHVSRSNIRKSAGRLKGEGMAMVGLVFGYIGAAMIPFVLIIAATAIPNLLRSRIAANEASAVGSLRTINTAEVTYASTYPAVGFASSLAALGSSASGCATPSATKACLLDNILGCATATCTKSGYKYAFRNSSGDGSPTSFYSVVAYPVSPNESGVRVFCTDASGVIRYERGGSAETCGESSPPLR